MNIMNKTQVTMFEFSGLSDNKKLAPFLFFFFLLVYAVTVLGNVGMIFVVHAFSSLHTPMYFFLNYLSLVDFFYASTLTPKMLSDLISEKRSISFVGCAIQFFFFAALASTEVFILSCMAYDRYAAICHPLHYVLIMTKKKCWCLVLFSFCIGFCQAVVPTSCVFNLQFCRSNLINHYYCDIPPLLQLACSNPHLCYILINVFVCLCTISSMVIILVSYMHIISSILKMKTFKSQRKAFSTCSSHLICSTMFYVTVFINYFSSSSDSFEKHDRSVTVFYSLVTPMLNPLIYSLRNQEVKRVIMQIVRRHQSQK
ncbi:olfactory receptor 5AP2-like [Aquarana catesbeiana]|uniref:olfactory receptor 5AP2-like n=1 Tax=Aquarana catesbeiana TaxID=8400 RepID=UPI003CCA2DB1